MKEHLLARTIPEERTSAVRRALQETFGTTTISEIQSLVNGYSGALVYKIAVNDSNYLLRITTQITELTDPRRQFKCLTIAAANGVAPKVYYTNVNDGLSITEFIAARPMDELFSILREPVAFAALVRSIHTLPSFPSLINFIDGVDGLIASFKSLRLFPESLTSEAFELYDHIRKAYPRDEDLVSSHNDLNPNNLLFDGEKVWVVDWEASFQNDRYVDLAIAAQTYSARPDLVEQFLEAYFEGQLDDYKKARFFLMQQICLMYYAMLMFQVGYHQAPAGYEHDQSFDLPALADFRSLLKNHQLSLGNFETKLQYGKVLFRTMWQNMLLSELRQSLDIIMKRRP